MREILGTKGCPSDPRGSGQSQQEGQTLLVLQLGPVTIHPRRREKRKGS